VFSEKFIELLQFHVPGFWGQNNSENYNPFSSSDPPVGGHTLNSYKKWTLVTAVRLPESIVSGTAITMWRCPTVGHATIFAGA